MSNLQIFNNAEFGNIRVLSIDGNPWFIGKDVAEVLGYSNTPKAIRDHIDDDDKLTERIVLSGQNREVICINESGLYSLILSSKLPAAKKFKHWVTSEVLPTIRRHGAYATEDVAEQLLQDPAMAIRLFQTIQEERAEKKRLEAKVSADQPKVLFADAVTASSSSILVGELAKLISQNGISIGQNRLFDWLRENHYLCKVQGERYNLPTQRSMDQGLFEIKKTAITTPDGCVKISRTVKVTGKGQQHFINIFLKQKEGA